MAQGYYSILRAAWKAKLRRLILLGVILVCHAGASVAIYYGLQQGIALCRSNLILFDVPYVVAVFAYAMIYARIIRAQNIWLQRLLVFGASILTGFISGYLGTFISFNVWGT
jgi:putative effector of murein hydrolase LrgA (UPF0299 family)